MHEVFGLSDVNYQDSKLEQARKQYLTLLHTLSSDHVDMLNWIWHYRLTNESWPPCHIFLLHFAPDRQVTAEEALNTLTGNLVQQVRGADSVDEYKLTTLGILSTSLINIRKMYQFLAFVREHITSSFVEKSYKFGELEPLCSLTSEDLNSIKAICRHGWFLVSSIAWQDSSFVIRSSPDLAELVNFSNDPAFVFSMILNKFDIELPVHSAERSGYLNDFEYIPGQDWRDLSKELSAFRLDLSAKCSWKAKAFSYAVFGLLALISAAFVSLPIIFNNSSIYLKAAAICMTVVLMVLSFISRRSIGERRARLSEKLADKQYLKKLNQIMEKVDEQQKQ